MNSVLAKALSVAALSMVPVIELRGAIPLGISLGLSYRLTLLLAVAGNMIPVPLIILFVRHLIIWLRKHPGKLSDLGDRIEIRARSKAKLIHRYALLGLFILVAIPLPGTGAWTGALVAALLNLRLSHALPVILLGVLTAGIIMLMISYGIGALL